ncbi:MAG: hypothetical protein LBJ23_07345 [Tannerella sp.]|nr:hypothetical protein [Tannerella sp.]
MKKRTLMQRIIFILMALIVAAASISYFILEPRKPWLAFYVACCGGVLAANLIIALIFVRKNFK